MIRTLIAAAIATLPLLIPAQGITQEGDPVTQFGTDDPVMNAAQAEARQTLALFLSNVTDAEGFGSPGASVKVAFDVGNDGVEVIWVGPFLDQGGGQMAGLLANQPNFMGNLNAGDPVSFTQDMVRDWALSGADGLLYGHYTTRVIVPTLPAAQAAQISALLSPAPVPAEWN
ncbi:MAG: DUF2314 domain-containing protein [Pseudomonadota bacterium]